MFIIYTKEEKPKIKFTVNLTMEEVQQIMKGNLFLDYPDLNKNDYIVVEKTEAFKYPILEGENIREMTRDELVANNIEVQLEQGEIIKNKKIAKILQPSKYHTWDGTEWIVNLDEVKEKKRDELKSIRMKKIDSDLEVNGDSFQVRERDLQNFYNLKIAVDINPGRAGEKIDWVLADNRVKEFTYPQLMNVLAQYINRKSQIFHEFGVLTIKLDDCNSVEEIEAIKWH